MLYIGRVGKSDNQSQIGGSDGNFGWDFLAQFEPIGVIVREGTGLQGNEVGEFASIKSKTHVDLHRVMLSAFGPPICGQDKEICLT